MLEACVTRFAVCVARPTNGEREQKAPRAVLRLSFAGPTEAGEEAMNEDRRSRSRSDGCAATRSGECGCSRGQREGHRGRKNDGIRRQKGQGERRDAFEVDDARVRRGNGTAVCGGALREALGRGGKERDNAD
ncbi:hypothetical protein ERJ75_000658400 [Trypanosoma vivax]|nr:hypothetical protein ERJ75_000658400 [Trypanosoma vivax]